MSDYEDPCADEMPDQDDPSDDRGFAEPPLEQAEIDEVMWQEDRDAMIDAQAMTSDERYAQAAMEAKIPAWERAAYDKIVELVNGEDEIESVEGCDDCRIVNGQLEECERCMAHRAEMYRQYKAGALDPEPVDDDDPEAIPERDIDWELKAERENSR